uniref:Uncharacterized protein IVSP3-2 n=1 Tax=Hyposoter didymator TaxID=260305 RepID=D7P5P4_HYPDD|nr:unknown [Hyposoter didymator]
MATFQKALQKHLPLVVRELDTLEKKEPPYKSLLSALRLSGNLRNTVTVFNALDQLLHRLLGTDDSRLSSLFKLDKRQSYVYVNGVLDSARQLFEPIVQYLPAEERKHSTIIELVNERIPDSLLQETLWKNLGTTPLYEVSAADVERLQTTDQQQGSLCWEFITGLISMKYYTDILNKEVFNGKELKKLQSVLNARPDPGVKCKYNEEKENRTNFVVKRVFKLSMYSIAALLLLSSKTMLQCPCAAKTRNFISLVFSLCDEIKLQAKSLENCKLLVFAAHEISKFPMVEPADRFKFRNLFITYRQEDIFGRPTGHMFKYKYLNELNFLRQIETAGLEPTYELLLHLLLTLKNDRSVSFSDLLYFQILNAICSSFGFAPITLEWKKPEEIEKYRTLSSKSSLLRLYGKGSYDAFTIFCLAYVQKMAYFNDQPMDSIKHLLPLIHLMYFNTKNNVYPITCAFLEMYMQHLPCDHMKSLIDGSSCLESKQFGTQLLFKYLSLVVNVMMMEQTKGQYTMVDFIEQSGEITLY